MDWLANAFWARIGWMLGELAIVCGVVLGFGLFVFVVRVPRLWRQSRCQHLRYWENGKCDAICKNCGKNLGFIGRIRDAAR